jgi:hypothetical protein
VYYFVGNHSSEIDGDLASGETYSIGYHYTKAEPDRPALVIEVPVRYEDSYVRTEDGWRFTDRIATILWTDRHEIPPS